MEKEKAILLRQKIKAAQLMLQEIDKELADFLGENSEPPVEKKIDETFLGDDGKEYCKSTPYMKAKSWYCCSKPLVRKGNIYECSECGAKYGQA